MAAPQIPNLLSMRRGGPRSRGSPRGRGRGAGGPGPMLPPGIASSSEQAAALHDRIIQQTDTDASYSRVSAVNAGYLKDDFAQPFVFDDPGRRLPIINRGTYVRTTALDILIDRFIAATPGDKQIISLGAGTDTRFFRLQQKNLTCSLLYHEIDYPNVSANKLAAVRSSNILSPKTSPFYKLHESNSSSPLTPQVAAWGFNQLPPHGVQGYLFHPFDLRKLGTPLPDEPSSTNANIPGDQSDQPIFSRMRFDLPTLLISECCLCYLETEVSNHIVKYFTDRIEDVGIVLYEPTSPNDEFGQMMFKNLSSRGLKMPTVHAYPTLIAQKERLRALEFSTYQQAADIDWLWEAWIAPEEQERVNRLEGLDEVEEWQLLARHYSVVWACRERADGQRTFSSAWDILRGMREGDRGTDYDQMGTSEEERFVEKEDDQSEKAGGTTTPTNGGS